MKRANKTIFQGHFRTNVLIYTSVTRDPPIFTQIFYVEDIFFKTGSELLSRPTNPQLLKSGSAIMRKGKCTNLIDFYVPTLNPTVFYLWPIEFWISTGEPDFRHRHFDHEQPWNPVSGELTVSCVAKILNTVHLSKLSSGTCVNLERIAAIPYFHDFVRYRGLIPHD